jgi:hypothetical protein
MSRRRCREGEDDDQAHNKRKNQIDAVTPEEPKILRNPARTSG